MLPIISCEQRLVTEFLGNILSNFQLLSEQYAVNTDAVSQRCSLKRVFLKIFAKLTGKHLRCSPCFNKVTVLRPTSLSKKRLLHKCFPINFVKLSRAPQVAASFNMNNREWFPPTSAAQLLYSIPSMRFTNEPGKPQVHILEESLVTLGDSWRNIVDMFMVSERIILRMYQSIMYLNIYLIWCLLVYFFVFSVINTGLT